MKNWFLYTALFLALTQHSCKTDDSIKQDFKRDGYVKNRFTDSIIPNLKFSVVAQIRSYKNFNLKITYVNLGIINVDSNGHYHFEAKVNSANDEFKFIDSTDKDYGGEINIPTLGNSCCQDFYHLDLKMIPSGVTYLYIDDSDLNKFDSIQVQYPTNPNYIYK